MPLRVAIVLYHCSYVMRYIEQSGLERILTFLQNMNSDVRQSQLHYIYVGCVKALMNNSVHNMHAFASSSEITHYNINSGGEGSCAGPSSWNTDNSTESEDHKHQNKSLK